MRELADTTVLNNFAQVRRPDLLRLAFPGLGAPSRVLAELASGERSGQVPICDWAWIETLPLSAVEHRHAQELAQRLDPGEAECLALAQARGWVVVTDDRAARAHALRLGLGVTGTLGVLDRLVQRRLLSLQEANALLDEMIVCGYRSPVGSLPNPLLEP
jgi:predicted nucleic acid-binding protein